jgi:hypothetical protein
MNMFYLINNKIVILQNRSGVKSRKVTGKRKSNGSVTSRFCEKGYPDKIRSSGQCGFHLSKPRSPGGACNTRCIWSIIGGCSILLAFNGLIKTPQPVKTGGFLWSSDLMVMK